MGCTAVTMSALKKVTLNSYTSTNTVCSPGLSNQVPSNCLVKLVLKQEKKSGGGEEEKICHNGSLANLPHSQM